MSIQSYRDLLVWKEGMELAKAAYFVTQKYPRAELFGMTSQIRRSASSIPANIAEGYGRETTGNYIHHLRIAQGSLKELETHLILSTEVGLANPATTEPLLAQSERLGRMTWSLLRKLEAKQ